MACSSAPPWAGDTPGFSRPTAQNDGWSRVSHDGFGAEVTGKGTIQFVEVFNEPNLPYEWGGAPDPGAYARLLAAAYNGVKRADPNVRT